MGIIGLFIVILLLAWLLGYFGRGRPYGGSSGPVVAAPSIASADWVHMLLVIVVILVVLRLLGMA